MLLSASKAQYEVRAHVEVVRLLYPGLVLLLLLVQLGLVHTRPVQVEPQGLSYPGEQRGEQRGHVCQLSISEPVCSFNTKTKP